MNIDTNEKAINSSISEERADHAGLILSVLCCIHCMAIPLLVILAPSLAGVFQDPLIYNFLIFMVVPVGLYAFVTNLKVHQDKRPLIIGIIGMGVILLGHFFHIFEGHGHSHDHGVNYVEIVASVVGGLALIGAHMLNIKLCRCAHCKH